jgi:hypothetical protein
VNEAPTADGGPGFAAFVAFFLLALALWFLMRNMNARMRRMSYRQQAAHRGKNDPQAGPGEAAENAAEDDGNRPARREDDIGPESSPGWQDDAGGPEAGAGGPGGEAGGPQEPTR